MSTNGHQLISTEALIEEYNDRIASRFVNTRLGSTRHMSRQAKIDMIVDELSQRADDEDREAIAWFES